MNLTFSQKIPIFRIFPEKEIKIELHVLSAKNPYAEYATLNVSLITGSVLAIYSTHHHIFFLCLPVLKLPDIFFLTLYPLGRMIFHTISNGASYSALKREHLLKNLLIFSFYFVILLSFICFLLIIYLFYFYFMFLM